MVLTLPNPCGCHSPWVLGQWAPGTCDTVAPVRVSSCSVSLAVVPAQAPSPQGARTTCWGEAAAWPTRVGRVPATLRGALEGADPYLLNVPPPGPQAGPAVVLLRGEGTSALGRPWGQTQGVTLHGSLKAREEGSRGREELWQQRGQGPAGPCPSL